MINITLSSSVDGIPLTKSYKTTLVIIEPTESQTDIAEDEFSTIDLVIIEPTESQTDIAEDEFSTIEIETNREILEKEVKDISDSIIFSSVPLSTALT